MIHEHQQDIRPAATAIALMWLVRGDYDLIEWEAALRDAGEALTERTAEYLLAHPLVPDHLQEGLHQHGFGCEE